MTATLIIAAFCAAGFAFMVRFLIALHGEPSRRACSIERILPHDIIDWDVDVEESLSPGVKHAVPRRRNRTAEMA